MPHGVCFLLREGGNGLGLGLEFEKEGVNKRVKENMHEVNG